MENFIILNMNKLFDIDINELPPPTTGPVKVNLFYYIINFTANVSIIIALIMFVLGIVEYFIYKNKSQKANENTMKKYKKRFLISVITISIYLLLKILIWTNIIPRFID